MRAQLLRGSPRRKAVAGVAAAITALTGFAVVQGLADATVTTKPATHLTAVGPTNPTDGFPSWYKDSTNLNVGLCLDDTNPFCNLGAAGIDTTKPVSFPDNYPEENFYQLANASINLPNGTKATLDDNLEASFASATPQDGQQQTFGRVRIRITTPSAGHYVITHPYGVDEFDVPATGTRSINFTEDIGVAPGIFTGALGSRIDPFLRWDTGLVKGPDGASYLGDAVTPHAITGSSLGTNFFKIDGPDIGGTGINTIQTNLFTVQGRVATNNGVAPTNVTYTRSTTTGGFIDAFARSEANQAIQVSGTNVPKTSLRGDASGNYFGRAAFTGTDPPTTVNLTNTSDIPVTTVKVPVVDQVAITKATINSDTGDVKVAATSSDTAVPPTMTVVGFGATLVAGNATFKLGVDQQPPAFITVTSSKGGTDTAPLLVSGVAFPADPVSAQAPPTLTVQQGQTVTLDGSASQNATAFSWAQTGGTPAVTLTNANTAVATFTAPNAATTLTFTLTVQGPGGPQTANEVVTIQPVAPPQANAGPAQTVLVGDTVTLDGSASTGASSFQWAQTGGAAATLSSTTAVKPTFKMPNTTDPLVFQLTVTGPGGTDVSTVQISPKADVLTTTRVEYRTGTGEWRVEGTSQVNASNTITVHIGSTLAGQTLGTASPDALGAWSVRLTGPPPDASRTVSIESSRGGVLLAVPVNVRN